MHKEITIERVKEVLFETLNHIIVDDLNDPETGAMTFDDLCLDSLDLIELPMQVEREFVMKDKWDSIISGSMTYDEFITLVHDNIVDIAHPGIENNTFIN